jgi:hypothetical protein
MRSGSLPPAAAPPIVKLRAFTIAQMNRIDSGRATIDSWPQNPAAAERNPDCQAERRAPSQTIDGEPLHQPDEQDAPEQKSRVPSRMHRNIFTGGSNPGKSHRQMRAKSPAFRKKSKRIMASQPGVVIRIKRLGERGVTTAPAGAVMESPPLDPGVVREFIAGERMVFYLSSH